MKKTTITLLLAASVGVCFAQEAKKTGPERWESTIAKFEAADKENPPPKNAILFVGSSSIRMWKEKESFPDRKTINRGFGGSTLPDSIFYFDRIVTPHQPKAILVYAGDNDVAKGADADKVFADYKKLITLAEENLPGTPVIFIAIKPSLSRWKMWPIMKAANDRIAAYCEKHEGLYFAAIAKPMLETADGTPNPDFFKEDGLHMTDAGYAAWKTVIDPILKQALPSKG